MDMYIGFDSAWTDNPKAPGALCAIGFDEGRPIKFIEPQLATFDQALDFVQDVRSNNGATLVALDQPTVVPNLTSMRPVDRVAASLVSWLGGGVQPANRSKTGMFCDASPIWRFLSKLGAEENPEKARENANGLYVMEVFPALALPSLSAEFFGRLGAPKYNPGRKKTYRPADWLRVADSAAQQAQLLGCDELAEWCRVAGKAAMPRKADQDRLDAALCLLIGLHWRLRPRGNSLMIGDLATGYMILPASAEVRTYLTISARKYSVPIDGAVPA
jgi:predicted RNase H-like nuclease